MGKQREEGFKVQFSDCIAEFATRALLYEVSVTPKPGLVDRANAGSHQDMDFYTFLNSAVSLTPYFRKMTEVGTDLSSGKPEETFFKLQEIGKAAEAAMYRVTENVNTHKGAIFSLGILCGAAGRLRGNGKKLCPEALTEECIHMTKVPIEYFFETMGDEPDTAGCRFYRKYGIKGIRGEVMTGFPSVLKEGLPVLEELLDNGYSFDRAGSIALLHLITATVDTNMITRSDYLTCMRIRKRLQKLISGNQILSTAMIEALDEEFIRNNISPGGSADLLAVSWFLHFIKSERIE